MTNPEWWWPVPGTRWKRPGYDYNGYTVIAITNTAHTTSKHPPQVVYKGDNGHWWSLSLHCWPSNLIPEDEQ